MDNTIIQQGRFISTGAAQIINLRSDVDWMKVTNFTALTGNPNPGQGFEFYWQRGMAPQTGVEYYNTAGTAVVERRDMTAGGFTLFDSSAFQLGPLTAVTSISNNNPPRVLVASTAALTDGMVVRIFNVVGGLQLGAIDFTIAVLDGTHFALENMPAIVAAGGPGFYRVVAPNPLFYPPERTISKITQAAQAVVTTTVDHQYVVGQLVRFLVPAEFGMTEISGLTGSVVAVTQATFTVNIDTTGFTAFAFPLSAVSPFTPAQVIPFAETTNAAISNPNLLDDAVFNTGIIGMLLAAGLDAPAGLVNDQIYWVAGKSFSVNNN